MKARRVFLVIGGLIILLVAALVGWAVYAHRQEELEKNRRKTAPARAAALSKDKPASVASEGEESLTAESPSPTEAEPTQDATSV